MVAYYSQRMIDTDGNYEIYEVNLFAVIENFCLWRHYFEQLCHIVDVVTDHNDLIAFMTVNKFMQKQVR